MLFTHILLFAAGAAAWTVPAGQPNGVYEVYTAPDGTEIHTLIRLHEEPAPAIDSAPAKFDFVHKRQISGINNAVNCGDYILPAGDTDAANNYLDQQCGNGASVQGGRDFYSVVGCTIAYFCNYTDGTQFCFASERQAASRAITSRCGLYYAGWDHISGGSRNAQYGYENSCNQGWNFCGRGFDG